MGRTASEELVAAVYILGNFFEYFVLMMKHKFFQIENWDENIADAKNYFFNCSVENIK